MLYLEDYLEMIEQIPNELRDRFTEMREMDLQVHNAMDNLEEQIRQFFANAKRMKVEQRETEFEKIKKEYYKTLEDAEEKVHLANQMYDLVERYLRRLDQEVQKFKIELEADNAGITETLERRSLALDNTPPAVVNHVREKRKYTIHNNSANASVNNSGYSRHHERHMSTPTEKVLSSIAHEAFRETASPATSSSSGVITSSNITSNRLNSNAFTPLLAVVSGNNSCTPNGNSTSSFPSLTNQSVPLNGNDRVSGSNTMIPHNSPYRFNCSNVPDALQAAAQQAIAATQNMGHGRRTASLKASYEAINSGFPNMMGLNAIRDHLSFDPTTISHDLMTQSYPSTSGQSIGIDSPIRVGRGNNKRSRSSYHFADGISIQNTGVFEEESSDLIEGNCPIEFPYDPNEPRYCICNQVSYGDMVACDNKDCDKEWFHYGCVGITQPPKGNWYCPDCVEKIVDCKKKIRKDRS